jgi:hypothetical protein
MLAVEKLIHRKNTKRFIDSDPTVVSLITPVSMMVNGTKIANYTEDREPQTFKIIWQGDDGIVRETPGGARRFNFILLGEYDAELAIGDFWQVDEQKFVIEYIFPNNGYEVKAGGVSHGSTPA